MHGWQTKFIFRLFTCAWRTLNADNYVKANQCFKIIACDPLDDTVEQFASLAVGVADQLSKQDYSQKNYLAFYNSLIKIYKYERELYDKLDWEERQMLPERILLMVEDVEEEVEHRQLIEATQTNLSEGDASDSELTRNSAIEIEKPRADTKMTMGIRNQEKNGTFGYLIHTLVILLSDL